MIPRRRIFVGLLGAAGLALYLWPAFNEPVVLWADGQIDLGWAREGVGLWKPLIDPGAVPHPLKPGYLLFLRAASSVFPSLGAARSILIVQSVLLWLAILGVSIALTRRHGVAAGTVAYVLLLLFAPLRNTASVVMPEALTAAILLPLGLVVLLESPKRRATLATSLVLIALFWVRPNAAAIAFILICVGWTFRRAGRALIALTAIFFSGVLAVWVLTGPFAGADRGRGMSDAILSGSAEYGWTPALGTWAAYTGAGPDSRFQRARDNWGRLFAATPPDRSRELIWKALHGILGLEYYDSRWSPIWRGYEHAARTAAPFLILGSIAVTLTTADRVGKICAANLAVLLVGQGLLIGSAPRFATPLLPIFLLLAVRAAFSETKLRVPVRAGLCFVLLIAAVALVPYVASWDWGQIESAGVTIEQKIPKGSLPRHPPVTFHLRIAPPDPSAGADIELAIGAHELSRVRPIRDGRRPVLSFAVPAQVLEQNIQHDVMLRVTSIGAYGPFSTLIFPVVPAPWRFGARRLGSAALSPSSDVVSGSLDWWAHAGAPERKPATACAK